MPDSFLMVSLSYPNYLRFQEIANKFELSLTSPQIPTQVDITKLSTGNGRHPRIIYIYVLQSISNLYLVLFVYPRYIIMIRIHTQLYKYAMGMPIPLLERRYILAFPLPSFLQVIITIADTISVVDIKPIER